MISTRLSLEYLTSSMKHFQQNRLFFRNKNSSNIELNKNDPNQYKLIRQFSTANKKINGLLSIKKGLFSLQIRFISSYQLTKSIQLFSENNRCVKKDEDTLCLKTPLDKPIVVMLPWLMAKQKHVRKYAQLYIDQGYDVLRVSVSPWQVIWPKNGSQLVAAEVVKFLSNNISTQSIIVHGFSVGGYLWGECMVHMSRDIDRYRQVINQINGQVWDSLVELTEIPVGVPKSVFPKNETLQRALSNYLTYHMKKFHEPATSHYIRSSQIFHSTLIRKPALFFLSESDPISSPDANKQLRDSWQSLGINCALKTWQNTPHVGHFARHKDEYVAALYNFLDSIKAKDQNNEKLSLLSNKYKEKIQARI